MRSARSGGIAARAEVSAGAMLGSASAGGVHGTSGRGEAPRTPETLGVPAHPARRSADARAARLTARTPYVQAAAMARRASVPCARPIASAM